MSDENTIALGKVLLVDDHPFIRTIMRQLLHQLGVREVVEAGDGEEALEKCAYHQFDVIFLDVEMEPLDGLDCLRRIRSSKNDTLRDVPVVMLTSHAEADLVLSLKDAGVQGYILKPPNLASVQKSLERIRPDLTIWRWI